MTAYTKTSHRMGIKLVAGLTTQALRLLKSLSQPDAYALLDPLDSEKIVIRKTRGNVSLGGGRFPIKILGQLLEADLVQVTHKNCFAIKDSGLSYVKRSESQFEDRFLNQHRHIERVSSSHFDHQSTGQHDKSLQTRSFVQRNTLESPLSWLKRHKDRSGHAFIDDAAFEAGERLRRDLTFAQMLPGISMNWSTSGTQGNSDGTHATDSMIAARQRVTKAFQTIGAEFADFLMDLCGFLKGLEVIELERGWPARSAKLIAQISLGQLARHYGLSSIAKGNVTASGITSWHSAL